MVPQVLVRLLIGQALPPDGPLDGKRGVDDEADHKAVVMRKPQTVRDRGQRVAQRVIDLARVQKHQRVADERLDAHGDAALHHEVGTVARGQQAAEILQRGEGIVEKHQGLADDLLRELRDEQHVPADLLIDQLDKLLVRGPVADDDQPAALLRPAHPVQNVAQLKLPLPAHGAFLIAEKHGLVFIEQAGGVPLIDGDDLAPVA